MTARRILVIKLSAFGDFCLSLGIFEHLRRSHPDAHITLMTTAPFKEMAQQSPYFDAVRTIARWSTFAFGPWIRYMRSVWAQPYDAVYDLQSNDRTHMLRRLSPSAMCAGWIDIRTSPDLAAMAGQRPSDLSWLTQHAKVSVPATPYALLVAGSAPQHPAKRWPATHYAALAQQLAAQGITPVVLGTAAESAVTQHIAHACPQAIDLTAQTTFADIAALAAHAAVAVGNDTGPMHLIALAGKPVISLFSGTSDPLKSAPRGAHVHVLREENLADLAVERVFTAAQKAMQA